MKSILNHHPWHSQPARSASAVSQWFGGSVALAATIVCPNLHAILLYGTSSASENTTAPTGLLADSGWQYQGTWGSFLGTAIAPNYFVTAKHVGGSVGGTFTYQGTSYTTTASFASSTSDLRVWQVSGSFPTYAQLYGGSDESGKSLVVMGRGPTRNASVILNDVGEPAGWGTGGGAGTMRWGENTVADTVNFGGSLGRMMRMDFDRNGGANEAMLGSGDSGGGVFIEENGTWKLAGINYGINGPFNTVASDTGSFYGAVYDEGGLYDKSGGSWGYVPNSEFDIPCYWYATRISSNVPWIQGVTGVPEPTEWAAGTGLALLGFATWRRVRQRTRPA